ncbi:hypothetical protein BD310DRAFT_921597 [Dichomitus squalens]|uniref:Uncharacterized protein n=1 Tax=Dichomitus squalens TaxID=114155 RepID=A0A4Q9Q2B0_9APHY|nr:hypothetical protein BD310DRAFT_921597 [Dichomitus squalens]
MTPPGTARSSAYGKQPVRPHAFAALSASLTWPALSSVRQPSELYRCLRAAVSISGKLRRLQPRIWHQDANERKGADCISRL